MTIRESSRVYKERRSGWKPRNPHHLKREELQAEALSRARNGQSLSNYSAIINGFIARGIPEGEIEPRVNVLTYHARYGGVSMA